METTTPNKKRNPVFIIILALLVIGGGWYGISQYLHGQKHEETDDAQVSADIVPVIPRVAGYVAEVRVKDNQQVHKGDTLVILDNRDHLVKLHQAEAALQAAASNLKTAQATTAAAKQGVKSTAAVIQTIDAQIDAAKVTLWRTSSDYERFANLIKDHSVTQQQYEQALAAKQAAEKQVAILEQQKRQASSQTTTVAAQSTATSTQIQLAEAAIKQRQVDVEAAELTLSYTVLVAQEDGLASKVNVKAGQFVQAGQSLFSLVHSNALWVTANFKETQLNKMTTGQKVTVHADVFPNHEFEARVASFSPATGSTFALLPPDNASGNFVKVVQRLPVRIEFSNAADSLVNKLRPGMNVVVDVHLQ